MAARGICLFREGVQETDVGVEQTAVLEGTGRLFSLSSEAGVCPPPGISSV